MGGGRQRAEPCMQAMHDCSRGRAPQAQHASPPVTPVHLCSGAPAAGPLPTPSPSDSLLHVLPEQHSNLISKVGPSPQPHPLYCPLHTHVVCVQLVVPL